MDRKYSAELRERALRMPAESKPAHPATTTSAIRHVAGMLGMSPETLRLWQRRYEVDAGVDLGLSMPHTQRVRRDAEQPANVSAGNVQTRVFGEGFGQYTESALTEF